MIDDTFIGIVGTAICLAIVGLDLHVLLQLRRLRLPEVATVLWVMWVIAVPLVGAASFLIVRPQPAPAAQPPALAPVGRRGAAA